MTRLAPFLAVSAVALLASSAAPAADYGNSGNVVNFFGDSDDLRSGFSSDFDNSNAYDPLTFELGVRYWYSWGAQSFGINSVSPALSVDDQSHSLEGHFRIDDNSTKFYAKGLAGASFLTNGSFTGLDSGSITGGHIGYAGADIGYSWLGGGKGSPSFGPFLGYMYWNDSPNASNTSSGNSYTTATSASDITVDPTTGQTFWPGSSTPNNVEMNMLRLGFSGKADLGQYFDVSGEVAAVPYAKLDGVLGTSDGATLYYTDPPGSGTSTVTTNQAAGYNVAEIQSSPTSVTGWGYGAMVEALVGYHPTDNLTFRVGGRLWYLQGREDATYSRADIGNPSQSTPSTPPNYDQPPSFFNQGYITRDNPWSLFRYGLLAEMTYKF